MNADQITCPTVRAWVERGWWDLQELEHHAAACPDCQMHLASVLDALKQVWPPEEEER